MEQGPPGRPVVTPLAPLTAAAPAAGRATMRDVAALAGVSLKAVSRVVNGAPTVDANLGGKNTSALCSASVSAPAGPIAIPTTAGTLTVSPATLEVSPPNSGTITLTASGGPVSWTVSEPPGMEKKVVVAPMSGSLPAGGTATITVTLEGSGKPTVHLTFSPGGATVTVDIN